HGGSGAHGHLLGGAPLGCRPARVHDRAGTAQRAQRRPLNSAQRRPPVSIPQRDLASVDYFFDPEILQDPYPYYDHARAQGPVAPGMPYDAIAITGYEEAVAVFNDPASFSNCNSMSGPFSGLVAPEGADDIT